jgi:hypothetical protein
MKNNNKFFLIYILLIANACNREVITAENIELGKEYFPIETNKYVEYLVDSIVYDDFNKKVDTIRSEVRIMIGSDFEDNEGRDSKKRITYYRKNESEPWIEVQNGYVTSSSMNIEVLENNLRFIKMVFPVKENTKWFGNTYISTQFNPELQWLNNKNWDYKYENLSKPFNNGVLTFNSTALINQINDYTGDSINSNSYSDRTFSQEVYAKNVGLIYKNLAYWVYQSNIGFRKGFVVTMRAKNYN